MTRSHTLAQSQTADSEKRQSDMASESRTVELNIGGKKRVFDIDDPKLPDWVDDNDITAGGYPYKKRMDKDEYDDYESSWRRCRSRSST